MARRGGLWTGIPDAKDLLNHREEEE